MIGSSRFTVVLDTCVIYPIYVRDILLWFAHYDLYTPKWSEGIFDELTNIMKRKGADVKTIENRLEAMNLHFPDAMVKNYKDLIDKVKLPDPKDNHVFAAAIKTNANLIVTHNLKDFPKETLSQYGLNAKSPDDFIADLIDLKPEVAVKAFKEMVLLKQNPDMDEYAVLDALRKANMKDSADYLHALI